MHHRIRPFANLRLTPIALIIFAGLAFSHPLGNFTINHYARIVAGPERTQIRYVVDLAEIPTFQEAKTIDQNSDGNLSSDELNSYLDRIAPGYMAALRLTANEEKVALAIEGKSIKLQPGAANLPTMRIVLDLVGEITNAGASPRLRFVNDNLRERAGWAEVHVTPLVGATVFNSTLYGNGVTDELKVYPADLLMAPLNERVGEWSVTRGATPPDAKVLTMRDGRPVVVARDRFAELIAVPELTFGVALLGILIAFILGSGHALTPGHSKALVGAYLVGSRGTIKHAAFLGLTVTITHVSSAYALSLLLISFSILAPERLQIIPSLISSLMIIIMGVVLFTRRLRGYLGGHSHDHDDHGHTHDHAHGPSHLPPGADGAPVTWRTLLPLGVSGGLLPCPSAILVVLAANALGRDLYGLLLVTAFSLGLAGVLTTVGIIFIKAGDWLHLGGRAGRLVRLLPIASAAFITMVGFIMLYQTLKQSGVSAATLWEAQNLAGQPAGTIPIISILIGGLILGLKHAVEADHLAAVSTIVSERKSILSSSLVGGLWGLGHTISLLIAGLIVIILKVQIPDRLALALEFCVALMLIGLGINALLRIKKGGKLHVHEHVHGGVKHFHPHLHPHEPTNEAQTHHGLKIGIRPLLVGMVHGMAGSAALMLLVIPTIPSPGLAIVYISIFGLGSIGGMMAMSTLLGLPLQLTAERFKRAHSVVCALAACFSLGFGIFLAYEIGFVEGLLR
jgi:ABC-type nickel/cobalt efflux system permease component RcnA